MPTYEDLRGYFDDSDAMTSLARAASESPIVRGFALDVNPYWAAALDVEDGRISERDAEWIGYRDTRGLLPQALPYFQGYRRRDLKRKPHYWSPWLDHRSDPWGREPVILTIVYEDPSTPTSDDPQPPPEKGPPSTSGDASLSGASPTPLGRLRRLVNQSSAAARLEARPPARLAFAAGDEIRTTAGNTGTLGGILTDPKGKHYGMTCQHVAAKQVTITDTLGATIGACVHDTPRVTLPAGTVCDPVVLPMPSPSPGNGPSVNMLDLALIDLSSPPTVKGLGGVALSLTPGQNVEIRGSQTKVQAKLGSLLIAYTFSNGGKDYCFRDTIELTPLPLLPIGGKLGALVTAVPVAGDSGAFVVTKDPNPVWAGVFFGEDGTRGFAIRASWAHAWAEQATGSKLSV